MSNGDWRKFAKDRGGLAATLFSGVLLVICTAWPAWLSHNEVSERAAHNAAYHAKDAQDQIAQKCGVIANQAATDCAREINNAARAEQRQEYDLAAQETTAIWTAVMGWVAAFGVALSGLGVYLIWTTFRETQRAANATAKSYEAFVKFEGPMLDVDFTKIAFSWINGEPHATARFTVRNIGRSPAIIDTISVQDAESVYYNRTIASGQSFDIKETYIFPIFDDRPTLGCIEFITTLSPLNKRLFVMNFAETNGQWAGSIHPDDILDDDHPEYQNPFASNQPK